MTATQSPLSCWFLSTTKFYFISSLICCMRNFAKINLLLNLVFFSLWKRSKSLELEKLLLGLGFCFYCNSFLEPQVGVTHKKWKKISHIAMLLIVMITIWRLLIRMMTISRLLREKSNMQTGKRIFFLALHLQTLPLPPPARCTLLHESISFPSASLHLSLAKFSTL